MHDSINPAASITTYVMFETPIGNSPPLEAGSSKETLNMPEFSSTVGSTQATIPTDLPGIVVFDVMFGQVIRGLSVSKSNKRKL